jgi:hopanoid biosynthesis associated RND transporter like protein HpnN
VPSDARTDRSLIRSLDRSLGRAVVTWVEGVRRRAGPIAISFVVATVLLGVYAARNLGVNTDETDLFRNLPSFQLREEFYRAFPLMADPIVVVIDAASVDLLEEATDALQEKLEQRPEDFEAVYQPFGGAFFERNGLLYLPLDELEELADHLYEVQPYIGNLARDASLRGLFTMLDSALEAVERGDFDGERLAEVLDRIDAVATAQLDGAPDRLSWADVLADTESSSHRDRRRYLLIQPVVDYEKLQPAETSLLALREVVHELGYDRADGVRVRATGILPLAYEEMEHMQAQAIGAGVASFVLVGVILMAGLGSGRMVLASLATLLVGLVGTAAFAAAAVGHLNLISVAFAVLFIGLSIDFAIHLCLRLRELLTAGAPLDQALREAARNVGPSLVLCAATTVVGFYAFIPTDFAGVGELGLIAGTGMFISLFTNLTLLPALLTLFVTAEGVRPLPPLPRRFAGALAVPVRRAPLVAGVTGVAALGAVALLPRLEFDTNPLRVRDPSTDSVQAFDEMLADGDAIPWNMNILAPDLEEAERLAARVEALPTVDFALTLADFVPEHQTAKREVLDELAFVLLPTLEPAHTTPAPSTAEQRAAFDALLAALAQVKSGDEAPDSLVASSRQLADTLGRLQAGWSDPATAARSLARLDAALIASLPERLRVLRTALQPDGISLDNLPTEVREQMLAADGRARVEIFPAGDLNETPELKAYVESVQAVSPEAFGEALINLEAGAIIVSALRQALVTAAVVIALLLLVLWRSVLDASLVALPLALAALFTAALSVLLHVPFNYANVIVIPLLLGMGVDSGIHLVHRFRTGKPSDGNLLRTTTAAAVLLSALTTIASFGTLGFSSHRGMASLGQLLALGMTLILACNLVVLPAVVQLAQRLRRG